MADILRNWRHLDRREVAVRLAEFGRDAAKASAHAVVDFAGRVCPSLPVPQANPEPCPGGAEAHHGAEAEAAKQERPRLG